MPGRIAEAIYSWEEAGLQAKNRSNWRIIPATICLFGGLSGKREILEFLRIGRVICSK
ncbi:hypothetical protein MTR67_031017 [Solanum verrucosum]|uniref:Uncharacterized protein n=1 Tax=Solanum verrucosum TaxID=315347 RepID=A0AAF0U1Q2_SOLVR|nr:hypothetical protein MTR67_031017 [Solanum verrucosum]